MNKKALLAVLMAMILLLSGCALIVKDEAVDNATVIIRMGDQEITKQKVKEETANQLDSMAYTYSMYGMSYDTTDANNIAQAQEAAVTALKKDLVLSKKAGELKLDELTDEEKETVQSKAKENYESGLSYVKNYMLTDTEGMDEEALNKAAEEKMASLGVTLDSYVEEQTKSTIDDKLYNYIVKDVAVTDEEIETEFNSKVESNKSTYAEAAGSWATAANNGTTLYYVPAGVRRVKQILTKFHDEDQTAIDTAKQQVTDANTAVTAAQAKIDAAQETLNLEGDTDEIKAAKEKAQADKDAAEAELADANAALEAANKAVEDATNKAFENIDAETDEILASVKAEGADWQAIMDEKNQDPGMKNNEKGYAVAAGMTGFDSAFVDAAMALEKPGDISDKVKGSSNGYYIIRYDSDEQEGPVALETVKETISSSLLSTKKTETYNATVDQWVEEAGIKVDLNALKD
jgi:hypothetical protein